MKKKVCKNFFKHMVTVGFSFVLISTMSMTAFAADCPNCNVDNNILLTVWDEGIHSITPETHTYWQYVEYMCVKCFTHFNVEEYITEGHDYELQGNMLVCSGCGDSYAYTRGMVAFSE